MTLPDPHVELTVPDEDALYDAHPNAVRKYARYRALGYGIRDSLWFAGTPNLTGATREENEAHEHLRPART